MRGSMTVRLVTLGVLVGALAAAGVTTHQQRELSRTSERTRQQLEAVSQANRALAHPLERLRTLEALRTRLEGLNFMCDDLAAGRPLLAEIDRAILEIAAATENNLLSLTWDRQRIVITVQSADDRQIVLFAEHLASHPRLDDVDILPGDSSTPPGQSSITASWTWESL
jgi:hypothetical protein